MWVSGERAFQTQGTASANTCVPGLLEEQWQGCHWSQWGMGFGRLVSTGQ